MLKVFNTILTKQFLFVFHASICFVQKEEHEASLLDTFGREECDLCKMAETVWGANLHKLVIAEQIILFQST